MKYVVAFVIFVLIVGFCAALEKGLQPSRGEVHSLRSK